MTTRRFKLFLSLLLRLFLFPWLKIIIELVEIVSIKFGLYRIGYYFRGTKEEI